jgi:hypothetical protein
MPNYIRICLELEDKSFNTKDKIDLQIKLPKAQNNIGTRTNIKAITQAVTDMFLDSISWQDYGFCEARGE